MRHQLQLDIDGKMIGTDIRQPLYLNQRKVTAMKNMIKWPAQKTILSVKGTVNTPPPARIKQAAYFLKQPGCL